MANRAKNAQYAYGITIEAGNYNEVINGFEKRLKDLDKSAKNTTATFAALSEAMKSGKKVDFSKAEGQLTGLVAEMEEVAKWREQLAGGQKLSDMFDGLEQVKQSLGQVTGQLDKFGDNIEEIFSILQNVPQNTSKTFVDVRKVLQRQASDMSKIIAELNNPTEKTDVSALKNQLSGLATDFVNEWNKAAAQGIKMDQVVDFKPFATAIKSSISGARSLGTEFNDVSTVVTETMKNVVALYSVKHPTGMFKDLTSGLSSVESQAKRTEQAASKAVASFKATIGIVDKLNKSDMGLSKNSKEMEEFLAKLQNPEITVKINKKDPDNVIDTFYALQDKVDELAGGSVLNLTQDFFKDIPVEKLKELGDALQNIIAIGNHKDYKKILNFGDDVFGTGHFSGQIKGYSSDLEQVMTELESRLNEAKQSVQDLSNTLQQMVEKAGLKEIKIELGIKDDINYYVGKINSVITDIEKQANRIKKIPVTLAFDKNEQNDVGVNALKDQFDNLKKIIHDSRTEISQDAREIKQKILDALNVNAKDMVNVRAALEDAFNIEPLEILINDEFLVNQIQNALKNKTYDISLNANINGANYSNVGIPISGVGGSIPATQQVATADKQERASDGQSKAAEKQKSAAQTNDKSAQLLSKASQEMTAFVKKFANTYYNAQRQQKELNSKVSSGETLTDKEQRRLSRVSGVVKNLNPIHEYLKGIFGDKVDLSKITEESMSKVLTSLMQSNGKGSFKGELLSEDLLGLLTGLKGKYRSKKYGNGIGDLLSQLVGINGKNGTLDAMFKSFGLTSATFNQTSSRDYTAPDVLKYYQSFARLADIIDSIKMNPQNVSNELLTELANILKGMQSRTTSEEYRANITKIGNSINALDTNIKDYNNKIAATADLDTKEGEDYTPLLNMFKEFYSNIDEATKTAISSAIGTNPSENIIKGDQLIKAKETISNMSGEAASSKIANDLLRWLDRMIAGDNVILSRETLLSQLGKGGGEGLKVATAKNMLRKAKGGSSKNSQVKTTAYGIANEVLKDLDADIYYDGMGNPIVINRKDSPTQKRKSLRMVQNLGAKGRRLVNGTQIYTKDNPRPKFEDERRPESSIEGTIDWGKRLAAIDAELAKTSSEYEDAIKKRDETIQQIEQREQEVSKQIEIARKNVEEAKVNLSDVSKGTDVQESVDINNIKSSIRDREKLYNLMVEMDKSYIPDFELSKKGIPVSDSYKQLIEERKKVESRIKAAKVTSDFYKNIENGTSEDKSRYIKATETKVAEQENILANINTQINEELDSQKKQMDKDTYSLLLKFIEQYKERQNKLKGLEKDLSKYKEGSKEHDNILIQIDSLKTNLNSMIDEISQIGSTLGLDNKDLENAFSGMSSEELFSSKDARRKLEKEVEALSTFKKDSLANVSIFPDELKDLIQRRNELLYEKSDISNDKETLKKLKDELRSARERGSKQDIEFYKERVKIISEKINEVRPTKEINSEIKEIDAIIAQYIKSKVAELKQLSKTKFNKNTVSKYEVGGSTSGKYQKDISDKSSILAQLKQEARLLAQNKEDAKSDVVSLENKRKVLEKQRELAQLQVNYNTKRMEELQLTEEIASLEKSDPSSDVLEQKKKQLESVNAELSKMYAQIHNAGSTTSFETLDESLSADKKKLIALEKIIEAQKIIAQNEEMQNRSRAKIKDASGISNIKLDNETGKFTTLYGNESKLTRSTSDRFRSLYTKSEGFIQFRNDLYAKAREKIASIQDSISQKVSDAIDSMSKDAIGKIVQSKYGENGLKAHEKSWGISIETLDRELRDAIEKRSNSIYEEYNEYVNNILASNLNPAQKNDKITAALTARDSKMSSLYSGGTEFQAIFAKKAKKFQEYYYETLSNLLTLSGKSEDGLDKEFLKSIKAQFNQLTLVKGKGKDAPETAFGKKVSNILNQADEKSDDIIKRIYNAVDRKLEENILSYMKEISADETRLEGELANDVVFKDKLGNRINLAAEYRNANKYNLDRVTNLGQENKAQKEWIAKLREYGGISDEEMKYIQEAKERALLKLYDGSQSDIKNLDILIGDIDTTPVENATKNIADNVVMAGAKAAEEAVESKLSTTVTPETAPVQQAEQKVAEQVVNKGLEGLNISGISDERMSELVDMALKKKSDLISKEIEGRQSKSKPLNTFDKQKDLEYVFDKGAKSSQEFAEAIFKMVDAIEAGKNVANVEYGFTERNGRRVELATGDIDSVYYDKLSGVIDSMTHSHAYKKGTNNMMFSLADMKQMRNLAEENELSKYSLIYGKEMMSMNLGKDSLKTARAVAQKYPIINDVVTAMFATADGESVAAENSGEMARILNGYLQRVISEAGGELSVTNSSGLDVSSKYSITDDEYTKLNNVVSNFKNYFDNNYGKVTNLGEYTKVIKEYLSKEFGKNFIDGIVNKEYDKSKGGIGTEYSAEKQDDWQKLLSLFSRSKRLTENEQAVYDRLVSMPIDQLIAEKQKIDAAISANKEPEIKPTLTKAQIAALNPDDTTALQKSSIKQFSKVRNWNEANVGNIEEKLGLDNKTLVAYKAQFEELAKIAIDLKTKGEAGAIITKEDISQLDSAITKTKELQTALTKEAQYKQLKDAGLIVNGKTKIKPTDTYSDRQAIMAEYAKKYAAQNKSEYQFGQYDFINDKISFNMIDSAGKVTKAVMGWSDAFNTAYIQSSKLQGSLDKITQEIYKTDEAIKAGEDYGFFKEQSDGVKEYNDALKEYEAQVRAVAKSSQKDLDKNFEALHAAQVKVINAGKDLLDKQKDAYGFNNAQKVLGREGNVDAVLQNYRDQGINVNDIELVKNYNDAIGALKQKLDELKQSGKLWDSNEQAGLKVLADHAAEAEKAILKADEAQRQLNGDLIKGDKAHFFEGVDINDVEQVKQAMKQYALSMKGVDAQSIKWNEDQRTLSYSVRTGKREVSDFTIGVKELTNEFYKARTGTRTVQTGMEKFLTSVKGKFQEVARYIISFGSFYRIWAEIQKGVTYVREIDSALTELKKVTDETDETYAKFLKTMAHTADVVGSTTSDLTKSAADWARLGYSIQEAGELAKNTSILMNVSEFENVEDATDTLISALQAFKKEGTDVGSFSMEIIDKFNEVGNNYAISTSDLADSLTRSSAALVAAGSTLEESIALTTAANTIIQDPESVGNALKVVSMRIRGVKTELEDAGEETDGLVTNTSKLNDQIMALTASANGGKGIKIIDDSGAFRSPYEILLDIAKIWDKMDSMSQAGLLEKIAGKTRGSVVAALLQSPDILEKSFESATNAAGSATKELNTYLDSIEGRISLFTNAVQTMWMNLISSDIVKKVVNIGTNIIKIVDKLGLVKTALIAIAAVNLGKSLFKGFTAADLIKEINSLTMGMGILEKGTIKNTFASLGQTAANGLLATSFKVLALNIWGAVKAIAAFLLTNPVGWAILAGAAIFALVKHIDAVTMSHEDYVEELKETSEELKNTREELSNLNDELDETNERINELNSKDKLSFTEKQELKRLESQRIELERVIALEKERERRAQKKAGVAFVNSAKTDATLNGTKSAVYHDEDGNIVSEKEATMHGQYTEGILKQGYTTESAYIIDKKIEEYTKAKEAENKASEALTEAMQKEAKGEITEKELKKYEEAFEKAQAATLDVETSLEGYLSTYDDYLNQEGVEWQTPEYDEEGNAKELEQWQKDMNAYLKAIYDNQDKINIAYDKTGQAKEKALNRIFKITGADDEGIKKLKEIADSAKNINDVISALNGNPELIKYFNELGISVEEVADYLINSTDATKDAAIANKKLAKSQKMLKYNELYKQLKKVIDQMKKEIALSGKVTEATKREAAAIRERMRALEAEIDKYDILSDRMAEAKNNLDKLSEIQSADEDKNYITNLGNAAEIIQNAFNTGELASDSFVAAAEILLKPNFEMEDETAMMNDIRSQWENIQKYFTIEIGDDGSIEKFDMTYSNVMSVLDDAAEKGLIKWDEWHKEYTILEEDANKWNDALGVTDEFLYAFGNKIDNMNIQRLNGEAGNFIDQLNTGLEDSLYKAEKSIAELTDKYAAGELSFEEYISKLNEEESKRKEFEQRVVDSTTGYVTAQNEVDKLTSKLNELKDAYSAETDENKKLAILEDIKEIGTELGIASDKLKEFENELGGEPGDFAIQVMLDADSLQSQIEAAFNEFKNNNENLPTEINVENPSALVDALDLDPTTGKFSIPAELDLDENARNDLQSIIDLINLTNESALKVGLDPVYTKSAIDGLQDMTAEANNTTEAVENIPDSVKIDTSSAVNSLNAAKGAADSVAAAVNAIPSSKTITITTVYETVGSPSGGSPTGVSPTGGSPTGGNSTKYKDKISQLKKKKKKKGINVADGTAHASGNWGLPQAEHNSLVGELGPETVVDTHTGRYYTVGDHGAELVDLPKDAIIFNHLQTEQLFKNGHINSRGKSYANGNAYAGGTFYGDYLSKYQSGSSGYGPLDKAEEAEEAEEQFEEVFDWFEILLEEINAQLDLMNAKLENAVGIKDKEGILSQLLSGNHYKLEELSEGLKLYTDYANKLLAKIPNQYKKMSEDGAVYITEFYGDANEEVVEAINNYREWAEKVQDLNQQLEETRKEISSLRVQAIDMINTEYDNEIGLITNVNDRIQDTMDFLEESGKRVSSTFYDEMIKNSTKQLDKLKEQRIKMQDELDEAVKSGDVKKFSEDWYEMVNAIYDTDAAIIECETDIEGFQNSINDLHWDNFEKIIDAIDAISDEAEQLRDLIDDDDIADDVGNWTRDGIAALGLAAEEMEKAKYRAELYGKEIEQLNKDYAAGKYSTDEYNEKLKDLKDSQWDSIDAYESAKKAIINLNKTRIEAVKDGIQKEIDAYEKLISKRKEDLNAQKDAHDFNKTVQDQQKEIDKIQRQIDAMEGDTSAAAIAKRKKLQEELYNAQQELAETYYDHDIETQQNALDKELEAYRQEKEDRMEELDNYLKNEEQVLADSLQLILGNADGISAFLKDIEENYGVSIYSSVVDPWNDGADALAKYLEMLKAIKGEQEDLQLEADKTASALLDTINKSASSTTSAEYVEPPKPEPKPTPTPTPTKPSRPRRSGGGSSSSSSSVGVGTTVTVKDSATNFAKDGGNGTRMQSWVPGSSFTVMETSGNKVLIGIPGASGGQYTGWVDKKDLVGYAKGTTGVKKSQLARIDEGDLEELVLHADGNGRLAFLSKGTSVIPADITENLMKLGSIDPTEMLKRSTPSIGAPHIINNNMELNMEFGSLVHVDNCTQDAIPELQKMVRSEFDNMMKQVNNGLKRYAR